MHFSTSSVISILALLATASARIQGLRAPVTIVAGEPFQVSLLTAGYIQQVYDVAAAFGISPGAGYPDTLDLVIGSAYIGPELSNTRDMLNFTLSGAPAETPKGSYTLSTSVMSLYGARKLPTLTSWNVTVAVGDATSTDTVDSMGVEIVTFG